MGNRLYVGNLSYDCTIETLREAFADLGQVDDVHIAMDRETGRSRGFGFVTMATAEQAANAIQQMNGAMLEGRALRVNEAEERPARSGGGGRGGFGGPRGGGHGRDRGDRRNRW